MPVSKPVCRMAVAVSVALLVSACAPGPQVSRGMDAETECQSVNLSKGTDAYDRCVNAPTGLQRELIKDRETYGTV